MKTSWAWLFVLLLPLGLLACGEEGTTVPERGVEDERGEPGSGYAETLDQQKQSKADEAIPCGEQTCNATLCGYGCVAGQQCTRQCATEDSRPTTYIRFSTTGGHLTQADSRNFAYDPILSLTNVLFYGCELWDFSSGAYDGLELQYSEIVQGAFLVGQPEQKGVELSLYTKPFTGPGSYVGEVFFSKNSEARKAKDAWFGKESCKFTVQDDGALGLKGTFECKDIPHYSNGAPLYLSGEFACGVNSIDGPQIIRMNQPE